MTISRIFENSAFGYRTITVERPLRDEHGAVVVAVKGKAKGQPVADSDLRDTENVPLDEDVQAYFEREVKPHAPDAWIDHEKTKVGYEIPFNRHFYVFKPPRPLAEIDAEATKLWPITESGAGAVHERETALLSELIRKLNDLFEGELTDKDKLVYVNDVIKGKLLESETLQQQGGEQQQGAVPELAGPQPGAAQRDHGRARRAHRDEHAGPRAALRGAARAGRREPGLTRRTS